MTTVVVESPGVGADVESVCGKCGDVWHVVVAKVGDDIVKVECKECGRQHRHRSGKSRPRSTAAGRAASVSNRAHRVMAHAPVIVADPSRPPRPYHPSETYAVADQVMHPQFGLGVVAMAAQGRMEVTFSAGNKLLAHAKSGGGLERPRVVVEEAPDKDEEEDDAVKPGGARRAH